MAYIDADISAEKGNRKGVSGRRFVSTIDSR